MKSYRSPSIRRRARSRKTRAKPKRATHGRKTQRASHGGSQVGKKRDSRHDKEDTKAVNYISNAYPAAYFDGEDKFSLGDSFIA
jgi:hypothetical protein